MSQEAKWRDRGAQAGGCHARGFTMVELMVTLVVLAVLLAVAAPGMSTFVNSSRLRATQGELVSALTLARSEATKRGTPVVVEALSPVTGREFSAGWHVFVDANDNGVFDNGELVIRNYPSVPGSQRFGTVSGVTTAAFTSRGFLKSGAAVDFRLCGQAGHTAGYRILLEPIGLADVSEDRTTCS